MAATKNLLAARSGFKTALIPNSYMTDGTAPIPPARVFFAVRYPSPVGKMFAYLSPDPDDGKKHPAIIWADGGIRDLGFRRVRSLIDPGNIASIRVAEKNGMRYERDMDFESHPCRMYSTSWDGDYE